MFTGIVEELGSVQAVTPLPDSAARIVVKASTVLEDVSHGASIAVNGACLTVVDFDESSFSADVMEPTLRFTTIGALSGGDQVNLERAVRADSRLGGHIVTGHVDSVAEIVGRQAAEHWERVFIRISSDLQSAIAVKGSLAVDGVSLTVFGVQDNIVEVSLIPTTLAETTLGARNIGDSVNIETDVLAKYVHRLIEGRPS